MDGDNPPCKQNISDSTYGKDKARMSISLGRPVNRSGQGLKEAHNLYQCCQGEVVK
jgi:hypothetical protein